jgi:general secretion pathway protein A
MYNQAFGLRKNPFNMTPDPAFLLMTTQHREALVGLTYAILQRKGFVVLTGEAGTGKTTLLARVLQFLPASRLQFSVILNPTLTPAEFLELALLDFGIADVPSSKAQRLWKLQTLLLDGQAKGKVSALIIDEAHKLSPEVLEEIRLLGNFEQAEHKLLQIVMAGQRELDDTLNREDLRQLKQRIGLRLSIGPLAASEVSEYIRHRWSAAGGELPPFTEGAIDLIAKTSQGIPRLINSVCENALTLAMSEGLIEVERRHVEAAAVDLKLYRSPAVAREFQCTDAEQPGQGAEAPEEQPSTAEQDDAPKLFSYNGADSKTSLWTRWTGKLNPRTKHGE